MSGSRKNGGAASNGRPPFGRFEWPAFNLGAKVLVRSRKAEIRGFVCGMEAPILMYAVLFEDSGDVEYVSQSDIQLGSNALPRLEVKRAAPADHG